MSQETTFMSQVMLFLGFQTSSFPSSCHAPLQDAKAHWDSCNSISALLAEKSEEAKKTQLQLWKHRTREREYDRQAGECLYFWGFFLSSTKISRYSAEKTLLTSCSCPGSREGAKRREKLSQMDTDDQNQTVIPRVAKVTRWSVMSWKEPFWLPGRGFLSRCFSAPATATPERHRKAENREISVARGGNPRHLHSLQVPFTIKKCSGMWIISEETHSLVGVESFWWEQRDPLISNLHRSAQIKARQCLRVPSKGP